MSGNIENGRGCDQWCSRCLVNIRNISSCIRNFPFYQCFWTFIVLTTVHFVRSVSILLSSVLVNLSWFIFDGKLSLVVFVYSIALIVCVFLTFIKSQGSWNDKIEKAAKEEKRLQNQSRRCRPGAHQQSQQRQRGPGAHQQSQHRQGGSDARQHIECRQGGQRTRVPPLRHDPEGADKLPVKALDNVMEQTQAYGHTQEAPVEVHKEESHEYYIGPTSASNNEPLHQATISDSGSNLPPSSADTSTKSTPTTPLDGVANEQLCNDEPLQQTGPSHSGSNFPRSSPHLFALSTPTPSDNATNEEPRNEESLEQAVPSCSGSNLPRSSPHSST